MGRINAVIFDLYNTLIYISGKTMPYARFFAELGLRSSRNAYELSLTENFETLDEFIDKVSPGAKIDTESYEKDIMDELSSASEYPETRQVLEKLKSKKILLGLVSDLSTPYKRPFFDLALDGYFDSTIFSCDIGTRKPDDRIYRRILDNLGTMPANALMVGDHLKNDVEKPISLGMSALYLDRRSVSGKSICSLEEIFDHI